MSSDIQPVNREDRKVDPAQEGVRPVPRGMDAKTASEHLAPSLILYPNLIG